MAIKNNAAKPDAGKKIGKKNNNADTRIRAEIGKVFFTLQKLNGHCLIDFSTDCDVCCLNSLIDVVADKYGVFLNPGSIFDDGGVTTEVAPKVFDGVRKWVANTDWKFTKE